METVTYNDFTKFDIRIGTIQSAVKIAKSDKLLKLEVYFGEELGTKIIVSGLAQYFDPSKLVNQQVLAIINLPYRVMFGVESQAMILASLSNESLFLASCSGASNGSKVG